MNKKDLKRVVDSALWFLFCFILGTGLMLHYRLVPGFQGGAGVNFFWISRHGWGNIHFWASCLFVACLSVHLYLNVKTIKLIVADKSNRKAAVLLGIGIFVVMFFLLFPVFHGQSGYGNGNYHRGQQFRQLFR
nr:DUF4405 domain-containing protein [uncultured Desulfobacter sp.]